MKRSKKPSKKSPTGFWDAEYTQADHFALSSETGEDLVKFCRWLDREFKQYSLLQSTHRHLCDIGCGNGRHAHYLAETFKFTGSGFDISEQAISWATEHCSAKLDFFVHDITVFPYPVADDSCSLVIDMMSSHILNAEQRQLLHSEIHRMLAPDGWYLVKTFLLDDDLNAKAMIKRYPGPERNSYIHPHIGHTEYILSEQQLVRELERDGFYIHKISKSHKHFINGKPGKRRNICVYAQKK